jgi:hypothetical protein
MMKVIALKNMLYGIGSSSICFPYKSSLRIPTNEAATLSGMLSVSFMVLLAKLPHASRLVLSVEPVWSF